MRIRRDNSAASASPAPIFSNPARCTLLATMLLAGAPFAPAQTVSNFPDVVRWDWYFRQSLTAIDDWETVLAGSEATTPESERTPIFPVPMDGSRMAWSNPLPIMLLPQEDRLLCIHLETAGGKIRMTRSQSGSSEPAAESSTVAPGHVVRAYRHPGGGGKDQWYHHYERRFDQLTAIRPQLAPFTLQLDAPLDFRLGANELVFTLRNVSGRPLTLHVQLQWTGPLRHEHGRTARESRSSPGGLARKLLANKQVQLGRGASATLRVPVELSEPGGGLLRLTIAAPDRSFWVPLLTYVEDVSSVLDGIGRIISDMPDAAAAARLARLREEAARQLADRGDGAGWRELFERASALRDELLLRRIDFDRLLFVKRKPFYSEQPFMDAHHCYNRPGGGIYVLSPVRPDGTVKPVVDGLGVGIYRDLCLHWDGRRLLFAFGNGSDRYPRTTGRPLSEMQGKRDYDLYEIHVDGTRLRQLTASDKNDCEPFYLPNGQIGFTSDRSEQFVMCGSDIHVANLFTMNADGSGLRQLSFNVFNEFNPSVLPDGRILYNRWEYNERSVTSLHDLFTIHPDGTHVAPFYGNATIRPNVIMFPRAVPGSNKVTALFTGHHGQTHGPIGRIDVDRGVDGPGPITLLTPGVPMIGERIEDSRRGWYSDPQPLSEITYLCSYTPTVLPWLEKSWAIYVGDRHGNLALVYRDGEISCAEPVPVVARPRPRVLPPAQASAKTDQAAAGLLLVDVYEGLPGVAGGAARYLRILEDVPRKGVPTGGVICTSGTQIYTVKRILGTVPIEDDGSAFFLIPANRNLYFEVLDENRREIQRMRSVVCLKPNEWRTCVGCHEPRSHAPPSRLAKAFRRPPSRPEPPPWGARPISFLRDIQPLLNDSCLGCHAYDRPSCGVILTDDLTDQFTVAYEELLGYLSVASAKRWDNPDDVHPRPPYTYGSNASPLMKLLVAGHHSLSLSDGQWQRLAAWIDANGVYYDRYETYTNNRHIFVGAARRELDAVYARRCAKCHGEKDDGRFGTWWLSLNRRDVDSSRALRAPLARSAGGWQRCEEIVFADANDPDYQRLRTALATIQQTMSDRPRADLVSLRGTAAELQRVVLPAPPPPSARRLDAESAGPGDWIYLSDLEWQSGTAGWTVNKDGLPRRDRDVENQRLRLAVRTYRKGIGTHAPSEIVYALDGRYDRFEAVVGGAEAKGTVVFQVYADGKLLYQTGVMHGRRGTKRIRVSVAGARRLRLVVTDAGDGYICDMADWADARLRKAPDRKAGKTE